MLSSSIRNFIALILWLALALASLYVNIQVVLANYLGCKSALELQGYEGQPLHTDSLVGRLLGSFFGEATLAQFFALGVALVVALSLFFLFHIGFGLFELVEIRKEHEDPAQVRAANRRIVLSLVEIAFLVGCLYWAVRWDLDLFRFRSVAAAMAGGDPEVNPMQVPSWEGFVTEHNHLFVSGLIGVGAWGYLAVTALGCFILEVAFEKLTERWARLMAPVDRVIDGWFAPAGGEPELFYGYDEEGQPVYDPETPVAYDTEGNPVTDAEESVPGEEETVVSTRAVPAGAAGDARVVFNEAQARQVKPIPAAQGNGNGNGSGNGRPGALFDLSHVEQPSAEEEWPQEVYDRPGAEQADLREVIGVEGEQVSLAAAQADTGRYYVDQATGQVWDRNHWESLHGISPEPEAAQRS